MTLSERIHELLAQHVFAEFITKEFGAAIDAAMRQEGGG